MATRLSRREGLEQVTTTPPAVAERVPPRPLRGRVSKFVIPEVIFGVGTLSEVGGAVRRVGGRRPMLAKAVAILSGNGGQILDYAGIDRATSPIVEHLPVAVEDPLDLT